MTLVTGQEAADWKNAHMKAAYDAILHADDEFFEEFPRYAYMRYLSPMMFPKLVYDIDGKTILLSMDSQMELLDKMGGINVEDAWRKHDSITNDRTATSS